MFYQNFRELFKYWSQKILPFRNPEQIDHSKASTWRTHQISVKSGHHTSQHNALIAAKDHNHCRMDHGILNINKPLQDPGEFTSIGSKNLIAEKIVVLTGRQDLS